ncbi:MAG: hypothetical protein ACO1OT_14000 [Heyndrickxia sp.]
MEKSMSVKDFDNRFFEKMFISRGDNFPSLDMSKENLDFICVMLHQRNTINEICETLSLAETICMDRLSRLIREGLVKEENGRYLPTFLVVTEGEGTFFQELCVDIGDAVIQLILENKEKIMEETFKIPAFQPFTFETLSLFILSDVILDCIQIDNVEELFLMSTRPLRANNNYYFALMEKQLDIHSEAFGIYGNHCESFGELAFCLYGNSRYASMNLVTLTEMQAIEIFGDFKLDIQSFKKHILKQLVAYQTDKIPLEKNIQSGLERLNMISTDGKVLPILNEREYQSLYHVANVIKEDLITLLHSYRAVLMKAYIRSGYNQETSFEEFFIWYYHFLYS